MKNKGIITFGLFIATTLFALFQLNETKLTLALINNSYYCGEIYFGEEIVSTGSSKDYELNGYELTNWINAKHTDNKATIIGATKTATYEGQFTITLNQNCERVMIYACGYEADAIKNYYLAVNNIEVKVLDSEMRLYEFENVNSDTLVIRNNNKGLKGRICISKIVMRLKGK